MQPYRQTQYVPLCCMSKQQDLRVKVKEVDTLGIKDQSADTLFMVSVQVNLRGISAPSLDVILLVEGCP